VPLRKIILDRSFIEKFKAFKLESVTRVQFQKLRKFLEDDRYDEELIKTHCMAIVPLSIWTRAVGFFLSLQTYPGGPEIRPVAHAAGPTYDSPVSAEQPQYIVEPDLSMLSPIELSRVSELTVSRPDVASITFHGLTDCSNLDIASLVQLDVGEVLVYPNVSSKPRPGAGLNKRSTVTMYQCWPPSSDILHDDPEARDKYSRKIQLMTEKKNAIFINYDCESGIWQFEVDHF